MIDPVNINAAALPGMGGVSGAGGACESATTAAGGKDFKSFLMDSLDQVSALQKQADQGVQNLATGQTDKVSEVLGAVKKADVAFSLLMEIRNKLMDAYGEVRDMRV